MTIFHLHVDGHCMTQLHISGVEDRGFVKTPFRMDLGGDGFEAPYHFTLKTTDPKRFKKVFDDVTSFLADSGFIGYVEGECVPVDIDIPVRPQTVERPKLTGTPRIEALEDGCFRESELHIAYNATDSDKSFRESLVALGFFSAFMDKPYGLCEILTIQGTADAIRKLEPVVTDFLLQSSEVKNCSIKREDIAKFWLSSPDVKRAPVLVAVDDLNLVVRLPTTTVSG